MNLQDVLKENKERMREQIKRQEKENRKNRIIVSFVSTVIVLLTITIILLINYNLGNSAYDKCMKKHNNQNYCISKL